MLVPKMPYNMPQLLITNKKIGTHFQSQKRESNHKLTLNRKTHSVHSL